MLHVLRTRWGKLVDAPTADILKKLSFEGECYVLLASAAESVAFRKNLAQAYPELGFGLRIKSLFEWIDERQEVWGDGRSIAKRDLISYFAHRFLLTHEEYSELPKGAAKLAASLLDAIAPWLPCTSDATLDRNKLFELGLTDAEIKLLNYIKDLEESLAESGYILPSRVKTELIPSCMKDQKASFVFIGHKRFMRAEREMIHALSKDHEVYVFDSYAAFAEIVRPSDLAKALAEDLHDELIALDTAPYEINPDIQKLYAALVLESEVNLEPSASIRFVTPAGPIAEPEALAKEVEELYSKGVKHIVIAVPTSKVKDLYGKLSKKLYARNFTVKGEYSVGYSTLLPAKTFMAAFRELGVLVDSLQVEPDKRSMLWWPPLALCDFLRCQISGIDPKTAYKLERQWRGDRRLQAEDVLKSLCSKNKTSAAMVASVPKLCEGKIASAMNALERAYDEEQQKQPEVGVEFDQFLNLENRAFLQTSTTVAMHMSEFGINLAHAGSLENLALEFSRFAKEEAVYLRPALICETPKAEVTIVSVESAARLEAASVDAVIFAHMSSHESAVPKDDSLDKALLTTLAIEPKSQAIEAIRKNISACIRSAKHFVSFEYALMQAEGKEAYPSAMLSSILAAYGVVKVDELAKSGASCMRTSEANLSDNYRLSTQQTKLWSERLSSAGHIDKRAEDLINVLPPGRSQEDAHVLLSASQIESYLECPYKWFTTRRLGLDRVDAAFSPIEMGVFVHRVLELCMSELKGSSPSTWTDEETAFAHEQLDRIFMEQAAEQYSDKNLHQALIAHTQEEKSALLNIKDDLHSTLDYMSQTLYGFSPDQFELNFGKDDARVSYAGVDLVGTIDRVDVDAHKQIVILDYKHKGASGFASAYSIKSVVDELKETDGVLEHLPEHVQSLIYAQVMRRLHPEYKLVGSLFLSTKGDRHVLTGAVLENIADRVMYEKFSSNKAIQSMTIADDQKIKVKLNDKEVELKDSGMNALLDAVELLIEDKLQAMLAGDVAANPRDEYSCQYCPVHNCEKRLS